MTIAELIRAIESKKRIEKEQAQERATYDYLLANLIGLSVSRVFNKANKMPKISDVYPSLFDSGEIEEKQQEKKDELSVLRFKQFSQNFNKKFDKEVGKE